MAEKAKDRTGIRGFIFDMDGTLLDTEKLYYRFWQELKAERGYVLTEEMLRKMRGASIPAAGRVFEEANPGFDFWEERKLRTKRVYDYIEAHGVPKKPGMDELFHWLRARKYRVALASSSPGDLVTRYLKSLDYAEAFDFICSGEMVEKSKPEPEIFLYCAEQLGLLPMECAVVEDSHNGILAGHRAGMYVIGIEDLSDLGPVRPYMDAELGGLAEIIGHFA